MEFVAKSQSKTTGHRGSSNSELHVRDGWTRIEDFMRVVIVSYLPFLGSILNNRQNNIEKHKREWIACRRSTYERVVNRVGKPKFIYNRFANGENIKDCLAIEVVLKPGREKICTLGLAGTGVKCR